MPPILSEPLSLYLENLQPRRSNLLMQLEEVAKNAAFPIVGPQVGAFLCQQVSLVKATRILELGSGFGYSALWMAQALPEGGIISCTERDPEMLQRLKKNFASAGLSEKLSATCGDALQIASKMTEQFDIVFNDLDKAAYPSTIGLAKRLLRPGGLFITDNVLWSGRVSEPNADVTTRAIIRFTNEMYSDEDFACSLIPLRDGLLYATFRRS